jgi:methylisocitrate lyase
MLEMAGAAAIEIEDQVAPKRAHHHKGVEHLVPAEEMCGRIKAALDARRSAEPVIIVRCNALSHEGIEPTLERLAAYEEAGAEMLMALPRSQEQFEAVSKGTRVPLAAMTIGPGRPKEEMLAAGYPLSVDPMSATVLAFNAIKAGYEGIRDGTGFGMTGPEVMAVIHEVGDTMDIQDLYDIEARTSERAHYEGGGH